MAYHPSAITPLVRRYAPRSLGARGPVPIRPPFLGDITSSALSIVNTSPLGTVTRPLSSIVSSLGGLFGLGKPYVAKDEVQEGQSLLALVQQGPTSPTWIAAFQALMGRTGRYGWVACVDKRSITPPYMAASGEFNAYPNVVTGPSNTPAKDNNWKLFQAACQYFGIPVPPTSVQGSMTNPVRWTPTPTVATPPGSALDSAGNPGIAANLYGTPQLEPAVPPGQSGYATQVARSGLAMGTGGGMGSLPLILGAGALAWVLLKGRR